MPKSIANIQEEIESFIEDLKTGRRTRPEVAELTNLCGKHFKGEQLKLATVALIHTLETKSAKGSAAEKLASSMLGVDIRIAPKSFNSIVNDKKRKHA